MRLDFMNFKMWIKSELLHFYRDFVAIDGDIGGFVEVVRNDLLIAVSDAGRIDFKRHFGKHFWLV